MQFRANTSPKIAKIQSGCIISFDTTSPCIKIMNIGSKNEIITLNYPNELFKSEKYSKMIFDAFNSNKDKLSSVNSGAVIVVLPNRAVAIDISKLPTLTKNKIYENLKVHNSEMYKNHNELIVNNTQISTNKIHTTFASYILRKNIYDSLKSTLAEFNFNLKYVTFAANTALNSVLQNNSKAKQKNFMFVDIDENETRVCVCCKGKTIGFSSLPFGSAILHDDKVIDEQFLWEHDDSAIAVINATEVAKAKKNLTTAFVEDDPLDNQKDSENVDDEDNEPAPYQMDHSDEDYGLDEQELEEQRREQEREALEAKAPKGKKYVKKVRKLPKFMQRPEPETPNQFIKENFRIILKWILLSERFTNESDEAQKLDCLIVNLPKQYQFLGEDVTQDEENSTVVKIFNENDYASNLEINGAQFIHAFNQSCVF